MRECSETEEMLSLEDAEISLKSLKIKLFPQKKKKIHEYHEKKNNIQNNTKAHISIE